MLTENITPAFVRQLEFFVADIEKVAAAMDHDGYRNFEAMGFKRVYFRSNYSF